MYCACKEVERKTAANESRTVDMYFIFRAAMFDAEAIYQRKTTRTNAREIFEFG
jgi:hypothetical protein